MRKGASKDKKPLNSDDQIIDMLPKSVRPDNPIVGSFLFSQYHPKTASGTKSRFENHLRAITRAPMHENEFKVSTKKTKNRSDSTKHGSDDVYARLNGRPLPKKQTRKKKIKKQIPEKQEIHQAGDEKEKSNDETVNLPSISSINRPKQDEITISNERKPSDGNEEEEFHLSEDYHDNEEEDLHDRINDSPLRKMAVPQIDMKLIANNTNVGRNLAENVEPEPQKEDIAQIFASQYLENGSKAQIENRNSEIFDQDEMTINQSEIGIQTSLEISGYSIIDPNFNEDNFIDPASKALSSRITNYSSDSIDEDLHALDKSYDPPIYGGL